jgi:hypothetical protein
MLFSTGHCIDVVQPAATVVTSVCSNVCHVSCFWRRRQGTWPSYLENWGEILIFGCFCFQLEASLYIDRTATARQQTWDTIFLPVLDFWILLVARIYPIYWARTGVVMFAEHTFILIHARQVVFKICCKMSLWKAGSKLYLYQGLETPWKT